jgi:hypothetical protein
MEDSYNRGIDRMERQMAQLCGKGIWLAHSHDFERAVEMATRIGGTHLMIKVGHGPIYFPETTREMALRARAVGMIPLAWVELTQRAPQDARKAVVEALSRGYEAVVLFLTPERAAALSVPPMPEGQPPAQRLTEALINVEIPKDRLLLASPPLQYLPNAAALQALVPVCQGGWMPLCFAAWSDSAAQVIDQDVYQGLGDLSLIWDRTPDVYPVLSAQSGSNSNEILPEHFIPWVEGVARHGTDFFSVFHAANTEKALWPMLQAINVACLETDGRVPLRDDGNLSTAIGGATIAQPVYVTVRPSDTVWGLISRHGIKREQFWVWNGHLWESRGLPKDPDYLQAGWRIRVK